MKWVVDSKEMKDCDSNTIMHFGVPSIVLMERAALCVVEEVIRKVPVSGRIFIVCGSGNNGADGLAVARLLYQQGYEVTVAQIPDNGKRSQENLLQRDIIERYGIMVTEQMPQEITYECVIDALFGVGLSRKPQGVYAQWIQSMNALGGYKIAIDMPSGVSSDNGEAYNPSFDADVTVTFAYQKVGQILYPGCEKCGKVKTVDIGITKESWLDHKPSCFVLEQDDIKRLPQRPGRSNKGTFGRVLAVAGSKNMAGAALFCAQAAYCAGCGLVKIYTVEENRVVLQSTLPEAILSTYHGEMEDDRQKTLAEAIKWADVILIGPGIGMTETAHRIVTQVLLEADVPVITDADALNILANQLHLLQSTSAQMIVTPHLGEMARLCKKSISDIQNTMRKTAEQFAAQYHLICVLKDAVTVTAGPSGTYLNTSGCSAMAKGGSGDVLAGVIAALVAQGMDLEEAAYLGVYVHGLAGEAAAQQKGSYSVLARDMIHAIGTVIGDADCRNYESDISK